MRWFLSLEFCASTRHSAPLHTGRVAHACYTILNYTKLYYTKPHYNMLN
jgi:hypothetical protein